MHKQYYIEQKKVEKLISRRNQKADFYNGIYDRYEYPVLTREFAPVHWRYDLNEETNPYFMERLGINAVMNLFGGEEFVGIVNFLDTDSVRHKHMTRIIKILESYDENAPLPDKSIVKPKRPKVKTDNVEIQSSIEENGDEIDTEFEPLVEKPWGQKVGYVLDNNGFLIEICTPIKN